MKYYQWNDYSLALELSRSNVSSMNILDMQHSLDDYRLSPPLAQSLGENMILMRIPALFQISENDLKLDSSASFSQHLQIWPARV